MMSDIPKFDLNTPDGGRGYIAHLFKTVLKRHDYRQYIAERLAGDFACTIAQHLEASRDREQSLQLRLNAADQRVDDLEELLVEAQRSVDYHAGMQREDGGERLYDLLARVSAALKPTESGAKPGPDTPVCRGSTALGNACGKCARCLAPPGEVKFKGMIETACGTFAVMINEANIHYGWTFQRSANGMWVSGRKATEAEMNAARAHAHITNRGECS